eukprot:scaffold795_cov187-Amphora_coffeaeformis.AAC.22
MLTFRDSLPQGSSPAPDDDDCIRFSCEVHTGDFFLLLVCGDPAQPSYNTIILQEKLTVIADRC